MTIRKANLDTRTSDVGDASEQLGRVLQYLPGNYNAHLIRFENTLVISIQGEDNHGWTLDGYVLPRLASGNIFPTEVTS